MLEKVFHLLSGYAEFSVTGNSARFFNMTAKSHIGLWGYRRRDGVPVARIKAREYGKLRRIGRRSEARTHLLKKRGVPFQLYRLRSRKGLLLGAFCGAALYVFLSGFLWGVSVKGTQLLPDSLILEAASHYGLYQGSPLREFNPRGITHSLVAELPGLSWAGITTDGCFAEISVKEAEPQPEPEEASGWSNIVASREGKVVAIQAESGRIEVGLGEAVDQGQLLISGLYEEEQDPWAEPIEHPLQVTGPARGSVIAETYRTFTVQVGSTKKEWVETGETASSWSLYLLGLRIPLGLPLPAGEGRVYEENSPLVALGTELPVSLDREARVVWEERTRTLTEDEQRTQALLKLREAQRAEIAPGGQVVEEDLIFSFPDGQCILEARCLCREEIGVVQEVLVE